MTDTGVSSGKHYRLTFEEWTEVWHKLRPAEIKILYHLRTLDPFGDRELDIKVRELGRELDIAHSTVSRPQSGEAAIWFNSILLYWLIGCATCSDSTKE